MKELSNACLPVGLHNSYREGRAMQILKRRLTKLLTP
jgi:hypothetical protein